MNRREVITVRVLRTQKHKPGHPQFYEYFDPATGKPKREGCCDHVPVVIWHAAM